MQGIKITVLTPTYNRGQLLYTLYNSLLKQEYTNFEWVIVNDGSTDNTEEIVEKIKSEEKIDIKYIKKNNGGKPSAHNAGIVKAESDITIICDDDDYLQENALNNIVDYWNKYSNDRIGGLIGYRGDKYGNPLKNRRFPEMRVGSLSDIFPNNDFFDTTQIYRTALLKKYLFPITAGEKFVPEVWLWKLLDKKYQLIFVHKVLEICEYREDGLTQTGGQNMWNNPMGYSYYFEQRYMEERRLKKIKYYGVYKALRKIKHENYNRIDLCTNIFAVPFIIYVSCKYYYKRRKQKNH